MAVALRPFGRTATGGSNLHHCMMALPVRTAVKASRRARPAIARRRNALGQQRKARPSYSCSDLVGDIDGAGDRRVLVRVAPRATDAFEAAINMTLAPERMVVQSDAMGSKGTRWDDLCVGEIIDQRDCKVLVKWDKKVVKSAERTRYGPAVTHPGESWLQWGCPTEVPSSYDGEIDLVEVFRFPVVDGVSPSEGPVMPLLEPDDWVESATRLGFFGAPTGGGGRLGRKPFVRHKQSIPQQYFLSLPADNIGGPVGHLTVDEYERVGALEEAIRAVWPATTRPRSVKFDDVDSDLQLRDVLGAALTLNVDGTLHPINGGELVNRYKPSMLKCLWLETWAFPFPVFVTGHLG